VGANKACPPRYQVCQRYIFCHRLKANKGRSNPRQLIISINMLVRGKCCGSKELIRRLSISDSCLPQ
jgi:hypothetical protein